MGDRCTYFGVFCQRLLLSKSRLYRPFFGQVFLAHLHVGMFRHVTMCVCGKQHMFVSLTTFRSIVYFVCGKQHMFVSLTTFRSSSLRFRCTYTREGDMLRVAQADAPQQPMFHGSNEHGASVFAVLRHLRASASQNVGVEGHPF